MKTKQIKKKKKKGNIVAPFFLDFLVRGEYNQSKFKFLSCTMLKQFFLPFACMHKVKSEKVTLAVIGS